jgi:hypothetical protein
VNAPPRWLAWVPLPLVLGVAIYLASQSSASADPFVMVRAGVEQAMHGHVPVLLVIVFAAAFAQIGIATPFALHMALNPAVTRKGRWIVGGLLLAAVVLPLYASRYLRPS